MIGKRTGGTDVPYRTAVMAEAVPAIGRLRYYGLFYNEYVPHCSRTVLVVQPYRTVLPYYGMGKEGGGSVRAAYATGAYPCTA